MLQQLHNWLNGLSAQNLVTLWLAVFLIIGLIGGIVSGFFKARKIQPNGFKWKIFGFEAMVAVIGTVLSTYLLQSLSWALNHVDPIAFSPRPAAWWQIALEYAAYFILFDTWFYWFHRLMHKEPVYSWVHKLHHKSTAPNLLTTLSVNPLESLVNGGFVPIFLTACTVVALPLHRETLVLIGPTSGIMGLYVHAGYEFFPRWWNKSWATKWFITTTFHDQHHKYFTANFGGFTTVWDRICGTVRPKFEADFEKLADRRLASRKLVPIHESPVHEP